MDSHTYGPRGTRKMYENSRSSNGTEHLAHRRRRGVFSLKRFSAHERQPSSVFRIHPAGYALVFICMLFSRHFTSIKSDRLYVNILSLYSFDSHDTVVSNPISLNRQTAKTNLRTIANQAMLNRTNFAARSRTAWLQNVVLSGTRSAHRDKQIFGWSSCSCNLQPVA